MPSSWQVRWLGPQFEVCHTHAVLFSGAISASIAVTLVRFLEPHASLAHAAGHTSFDQSVEHVVEALCWVQASLLAWCCV